PDRVLGAAVDRRQRRGEILRVARDERAAQLRLALEMVVQARLGDAELLRHVGVAEAVESTRLRKALGDVEDAARGVRGGARGGATVLHAPIITDAAASARDKPTYW